MCCLAMSATTLLTREHHHHHHHPTPPTSHCATNRAIAAASALDAPDNIPCAYLAPLPPHSAPFAVQLLSDSQFNKIRANHHPNTLLLPPTLSALLSQPQNSSVPSTEFRIVPSADIPRIHSLTLSYVNSPTLLYTLPQPWIRDLLMDAVIYPDLLNRPHIWYALDGSPLSFSITRMRFFDDPADTGGAPEFLQIHLGRVTTDTRFILPPMTRASFFSDALPHTRIPLDAFGTAGARVADLFRIFKLPSFKILYGALLTGPTGSGESKMII
ncbi:hypothetical protein BC830DRAFT_636658 [Chytriomyces sp. MP71]|nr:hypothetical protein BC830DRAFT_636658 [Chytriomyces sp. MP71]